MHQASDAKNCSLRAPAGGNHSRQAAVLCDGRDPGRRRHAESWSKATWRGPRRSRATPTIRRSLGATDAFSQASILGLYDPDRSQAEIHDGRIGSWAEFQDELSAALAAEKGNNGVGREAADRHDHFAVARRSDQHVSEGLSVREVDAVRIGDARQRPRRREACLRRIREHGLSRGSGGRDRRARFGFSHQRAGKRSLRAGICAESAASKTPNRK